MLRHKIFAEGVIKEIKDYLPFVYEDMKCEIVEKERNNGQRCVGITFCRPGQEMAPVIYVEPFYKSVQKGEPLEDVMQKIARAALQGMKSRLPIAASQISEYDKVKEYLGLKLVNTKANRRKLKDITHIEIENLSLIPVIRFPMPEQEMYGNVKITEELRKGWGVSVHDIFEQAWKNEEPPVLQELGDAASYGGDIRDLFTVERLTNDTMYVLTNKRGMDGAIQIALPSVMEKLSELLPKGFFIIPSSIHETLIMPKGMEIHGSEMTPKEIGEIVREANRTSMEREEILSDRIYEYDKESGKIRQVPESIKRERGMER